MATIGKTDIGANDAGGTLQCHGTLFACTLTGTLDKITLYVRNNNVGKGVICAVYDADDNRVGGQSDEAAPPQAAFAWVDFVFSGVKPSLVDGNTYYLTFMSEGYVYVKVGEEAEEDSERDTSVVYGTFPASVTFAGWSSRPLSIYGTYTSAGGLSIPVAMHHYLQQQQFVKSIKPLRFPKLGVKQL